MDFNAVIKSLNTQIQGNDFKSRNPKLVVETLDRIYNKGEQEMLNKKYRNAYVFFQRWIRCVEWLKLQKLDTMISEKYFSAKKIAHVKSLIDNVLKSLELEFENSNKQKQEIKDSSTRVLNNSKIDNDVDISHQFPEIPNDEPQPKEKGITCTELFSILNQNNKNNEKRVLIIDVRKSEEFFKSRISFQENLIHIPEEKIEPKNMTSNYLNYLVDNEEALNRFKSKSSKHGDLIVLIDSNSSSDTMGTNKPIAVLKKSLSLERITNCKNIVILEGGFEEWISQYPPFVANSLTNQSSLKTDTSNDALDNSCIYSSTNENLNASPILSSKQRMDLKKGTYTLPNTYLKNESDRNSSLNELYKPYNKKPLFPMTNGTYRANENGFNDKQLMDLNNIKEAKVVINRIPNKPIVDRSNKPGKKSTYETISRLENHLEDIRNTLFSHQKDYKINQLKDWNYEKFQIHQNLLLKKEQELVSELELLKKSIEPNSGNLYPDLSNILCTFERKTRTEHPSKLKLDEEKENIQVQELQSKVVKMKIEQPKVPKKVDADEENIYNQPLKYESVSKNPELKRSHSSPSLSQIPEVDRSSKPTKLFENNNANRRISVISSKDRTERMEPVYASSGLHPGITGLKNLGNSCYMNSIIQCLSNTDYLARYFNDNGYVNDLNKNNNKGVTSNVAEEVAQVIKALWRGQYKSISPRDLKIVVGQYKLQFESYEQQDSHEFLMFLLDWMHNDLKQKNKQITNERNWTTAEKEWEKSMNGQSSIISKLFFGQLRSTIECLYCQKHSTTYETFNSLTMSLPDSNRCTLDDCVKKFVSGQNVSGWKCPNCKVPREGVKKFDIAKLPHIIVIHLNRFGETGGWLEKKNTAVEFPLTNFDLKSYLMQDNEKFNNYQSSCYNLYAMSNHYGTMEGGHYTAYCKSHTQNKWYKYDDHTVTEVHQNQVRNQSNSAYLLFYASVSAESYLNS